VGNQYACTLTGSTAALEGFGSLSADGSWFVFGELRNCFQSLNFITVSSPPGCYNAAVGTLTFASTAQRVIARVSALGVVDTSIIISDMAPPSLFGSIVMDTGERYPSFMELHRGRCTVSVTTLQLAASGRPAPISCLPTR
jgi:hypothetical protein